MRERGWGRSSIPVFAAFERSLDKFRSIRDGLKDTDEDFVKTR